MAKTKIYTGIFLMCIIGVVLLLTAKLTGGIQVNSQNYISMNEGWNLYVNNELYEQTSLDQAKIPLVKRGDVVVLQGTFPNMWVNNPELEVYALHSTLELYIDGILYYSYGNGLYERNEVMGYGYHRINLPANYPGKKVELRMRVAEDDVFTSVYVPRICNAQWNIRDYIYENRLPMIINIFLILFGLSIGVISGVMMMVHKSGLLRLFCTAVFSLGVGLWSFSNYNLLFLFTDDLRAKVWVEFLSLYIAPFFLLLYFKEEGLTKGTKVRHGVYKALVAAQVGFIVFAVTGQLLNVVHLVALLRISHILMILIAIFILGISIIDLVRRESGNLTLIIGVVIMVLFTMYDLLSFYLDKYLIIKSVGQYRGVSCIGTMIFVVSLMINFFDEVVDAMYRSAEQETLQKMAYTDSLTGLANRRSCEELFDQIDEKEHNYAVIEFDLNNLKCVNDTLGHEEGDAFITHFSRILKTVFGSYGLVSRIGGDEFLVIIKDTEGVEIDAVFDELEKEIRCVNEKHSGWNMSTAYGVSLYSQDKLRSVRKAYKKADERMYENKVKMKCGR